MIRLFQVPTILVRKLFFSNGITFHRNFMFYCGLLAAPPKCVMRLENTFCCFPSPQQRRRYDGERRRQRRRRGGQKQQLHAWQASSTQKNIVFSNLRLLLFPYNNIPLASPAIWFCSKPAIMPVEYYMLWTQPTNHLSELGNQTTEGLTDWRTKIVGTWYSLIIFGLRPPTQTYSFIHLFFDFILNILSSNHSAWLEIKDTVLFIAKVCIGTYLKLLKKINRCKSYE